MLKTQTFLKHTVRQVSAQCVMGLLPGCNNTTWQRLHLHPVSLKFQPVTAW